MKYALNLVYAAAALDEIDRMLSDEFDLTKEDLQELEKIAHDICDPDCKISDLCGYDKILNNLNLTPVQETLTERIAVLRNKILLLHIIKSRIENIGVGLCVENVLNMRDLMEDEKPF